MGWDRPRVDEGKREIHFLRQTSDTGSDEGIDCVGEIAWELDNSCQTVENALARQKFAIRGFA